MPASIMFWMMLLRRGALPAPAVYVIRAQATQTWTENDPAVLIPQTTLPGTRLGATYTDVDCKG